LYQDGDQDKKARTRSKSKEQGCSKSFYRNHSGVKKIFAKLKSNGDCHCTPGSGRKCKTNERSDHFVVRRSKIGTPTKKELTDALQAQNGIKVSTSTNQRRLRENGMHWRKKAKKSFVSEKNRLKRLAFAREHVDWDSGKMLFGVTNRHSC
jgi:transposase